MSSYDQTNISAMLFNTSAEKWETSQEDFMLLFNLTMDNFMQITRNRKTWNYEKILCRYYLPTVSQVFKALEGTGIALWIIGTLITTILIILFIKQTHFICKHVHKMYNHNIFHITSIYLIMSVCTIIGTIIPRANGICAAAKDIYMAFGIGHFIDLTLAIYGGEKAMISHVEGKAIRINRLPLCCCFVCIPVIPTKRQSVTILTWLVWQMKWSQTVYYFLRLVIHTAQEDTFGIVLPMDWEVYLNIGNVISFMPGVMSLILIGRLVRDDLQERYNFRGKARLVRLTIITTKFQRIIFEIMEATGVFPCYPPLVSQKFFKNVIKDFIYLIEVLILGLLTFREYMIPDVFNTYEPIGPKSDAKYKEESAAENGIQDDAGDTTIGNHPIESIC